MGLGGAIAGAALAGSPVPPPRLDNSAKRVSLAHEFADAQPAESHSAKDLDVPPAPRVTSKSTSHMAIPVGPADEHPCFGCRDFLGDLGSLRLCCTERAVADPCPCWGLMFFKGLESWRGVSDGTTTNNGLFVGLNAAAPLPGLAEYGFGLQAGVSYGNYDWSGREAFETNLSQSETLITLGAFRRSCADCPWTGGFLHDWMINDNFGTLSQEPSLSQWRAQLGYSWNAWNEFGVWGAWHDAGDSQFQGTTIRYRSVTQANFYWHHKLEAWGAEGSCWLGFTDPHRLTPNAGSLGDIILGGNLNVPLNSSLAFSMFFNYLKPSAGLGPQAAVDEFWDLSIGFAYYFGRSARSRTIAGRAWLPMLPVANNGTFFVDRS